MPWAEEPRAAEPAAAIRSARIAGSKRILVRLADQAIFEFLVGRDQIVRPIPAPAVEVILCLSVKRSDRRRVGRSAFRKKRLLALLDFLAGDNQLAFDDSRRRASPGAYIESVKTAMDNRALAARRLDG